MLPGVAIGTKYMPLREIHKLGSVSAPVPKSPSAVQTDLPVILLLDFGRSSEVKLRLGAFEWSHGDRIPEQLHYALQG